MTSEQTGKSPPSHIREILCKIHWSLLSCDGRKAFKARELRECFLLTPRNWRWWCINAPFQQIWSLWFITISSFYKSAVALPNWFSQADDTHMKSQWNIRYQWHSNSLNTTWILLQLMTSCSVSKWFSKMEMSLGYWQFLEFVITLCYVNFSEIKITTISFIFV